MDLAFLAFLIFTIPGFCFVWTFRHFAQLPKLGDFEYAEWSFLCGIALLFFYILISDGTGPESRVLNFEKPLELFSTSIALGLGISILLSFPLGYALAGIHRYFGWFSLINQKLLNLIKRNK